MKHPEEHILELYVLNAASVADRAAEIEVHLRTCAGCKALVGEISGFYAELDGELRKQDEKAAGSVGNALAKRNPDLAVWEERLARGRWSGWSNPVMNLRYYIRRYPIATAGATFAFAALAGIGLLMGYRGASEDFNPAYAQLNKISGHLEVNNRRNEMLWSRLVLGIDTTLEAQNLSGSPRYALVDLDRDGEMEVLTPLAMTGIPPLPPNGLHIFDGRGEFRTLSFSSPISFNGKPYELPVRIEGGSIFVVDTTQPEAPEILITAKNDRSPNVIVRMTPDGTVLGEYWHQGQLQALYLRDVDGDGRTELLFCGTNDVHDDVEPAVPFFAVLDPRGIKGRTESQCSPGYGFARSAAELYYVKLPLSAVNLTMKTAAGIERLWFQDDKVIVHWQFHHNDGVHYGLDFVLSRSFEPLRTLSTTQIKELFEREYEMKHISVRMDDAYLEHLRTQVRFWDGERWVQGPVRLASGITH